MVVSIISSLSIILFSALSIAIDARSELPANVTFPALIGFGDSVIDAGNNNHIATIIKCNFPPYGQDFVDARPTGRFSNGRILSDLFAEELGMKKYLPAYLDPNLKEEELLTGVTFASGGAGYDPLTSTITAAIPLSKQLNMYKEYIAKLKTMVGYERTNFIISNGVYLIVVGNNDILFNYFGPVVLRRIQYDFNSYADLMLKYASSFLKELYRLGARRFVVLSAPSVGCLPVSRTLGGGLTRTCAGDFNKVAEIFNSKLIDELESLQSILPDSKIVYTDIFYPILDIIQFPSKYGFEEARKGCCATGLVEAAVFCNKLDPVCPDDTKYVFWDAAHPTEKTYQIIVSTLNSYIPALF